MEKYKEIYNAMYEETKSLLKGVDFTHSDLERLVELNSNNFPSSFNYLKTKEDITSELYRNCLEQLLIERGSKKEKIFIQNNEAEDNSFFHKTFTRKRVKKAAVITLATGFLLSTSGLAMSVAGIPAVEMGLSFIPSIIGHSEKGKYWEGIHEYQDLITKVSGQNFERDTIGYFPDISIIEKYSLTGKNNKLLSSTEDGKKPILLDKPTKHYLSLEDMILLADSVVMREDKSFYDHHGISWKGAARAVVYLGRRGGGSTITMQVAKHLRQEKEPTPERGLNRYYSQVIDMIIASEIERTYSKEQILEFYLNNIYFGAKAYSAEYAAKFYFNKNASELTESEALFTACLVNTPGDITYIHKTTLNSMFPSCDWNDDCLNLKREEQRGINDFKYQEEYQLARRRIQKEWIEKRITGKNGYENFLKNEFEDNELIQKYVNSIRDKLFSHVENDAFDPEIMRSSRFVENFPSAMGLLDYVLKNRYGVNISVMRKDLERIYSLEIQTTIDSQLTKDVNRVLKKHFDQYNSVENFHYALAIVDDDGNVKAIIGDKEYDNFADRFNFAIQGGRPIASTIKPFVYAYGLEHDIFSSDVMFSDYRSSECKNPERKCISNHDDIYGRNGRIGFALKNSNNVMAVKAYNEIKGFNLVDDFKEDMGFLGIKIKSENNSRVAIGIDEATPLRLALAYSSLIDGYSHDYTIIDKIIVGETEVQSNGINNSKIFSDDTLKYMQDTLKYVAEGSIYHPDYNVGIKTGTNEDNRGVSRDLWVAGILTDKHSPNDGYAFALWVDNQTGVLGPKVNSSQALTKVVREIINCIE